MLHRDLNQTIKRNEQKRDDQKRLHQEEATLNAAKNLIQYKQNKEKFENHSKEIIDKIGTWRQYRAMANPTDEEFEKHIETHASLMVPQFPANVRAKLVAKQRFGMNLAATANFINVAKQMKGR